MAAIFPDFFFSVNTRCGFYIPFSIQNMAPSMLIILGEALVCMKLLPVDVDLIIAFL